MTWFLWPCVSAFMYPCHAQVCGSPEIKKAVVVQDISPSGVLYMSVRLCHVMLKPRLLAALQYRHKYFACVKTTIMPVFFPAACVYPILLMHGCVFPCARAGWLTSLCCLLIVLAPHSLACWKYASNCPHCTHSEKNERPLRHTYTHAHIHPSVKPHGKSRTISL